MRAAAVYAGLILNAGFLQLALQTPWYAANVLTMVLGPLLWGLFLLVAVYCVPARTGLGFRDLVDAALGPWAGAFIWWILVPVWVLNWFGYQTMVFAAGMRIGLLREGEWWQYGSDNELAVHWPWLILTGLAALRPLSRLAEWAGLHVKLSLAILLAAPFAYRAEWPAAWERLGAPSCCPGLPEMQKLPLWIAPALLFAGSFSGGKILLNGLAGIVLPFILSVLAGFALFAGALSAGGNHSEYLSAFGAGKMLVVVLTMVLAGRFCLAIVGEHLGEWRRWWTVFPVTAGMILWSWGRWQEEFHWQEAASPFLPLAGVLSAAYLVRREFVFSRAEQAAAIAAWVGGCVWWEQPLAAWTASFVLAGMGMKLCALRRSMPV
jgi:hypothetical protein